MQDSGHVITVTCWPGGIRWAPTRPGPSVPAWVTIMITLTAPLGPGLGPGIGAEFHLAQKKSELSSSYHSELSSSHRQITIFYKNSSVRSYFIFVPLLPSSDKNIIALKPLTMASKNLMVLMFATRTGYERHDGRENWVTEDREAWLGTKCGVKCCCDA